jgi:hypothetical protein
MYDKTIAIKTTGYENFRDNVHLTDLFEMVDCKVEILLSPIGSVEELNKMVTLIESMINVVDVRITSEVDTEDFLITFIPVTNSRIRRPRAKN